MKKIASTFAMFCLMAMLVCMFTTKAHAGDYLGDFCWAWTDNENPGETGTVRLGVTYLGGGNYLFSGRILHPTITSDLPVIGQGFIDGSKIRMVFTQSTMIKPQNYAFKYVGHMIIDLNTFNGEYTGIETTMASEGGAETEYDSGNLIFTHCQQ